MSHSVRLLTRLGIAIEKLGQKVAKIGGGSQAHADARVDVRFHGPVRFVDYASKANANYPADFKTLGDDINKHGALANVVNIDVGAANAHIAGLSAHNVLPLQSQRQSFAGNNLELLNRQYGAAQLRNFPRKESSGGDK